MGRGSQQKDIAGVIAPPPLIVLVPLIVGFFEHHGHHGEMLARSTSWIWRAPAGTMLMIAGAVFIALSLIALKKAGTPPEPWEETSALVTSGIFRVSRNPIYVGMLAIFAGLALMAGCTLLGILWAGSALTLHFGVVRREEAYLARRFGQRYAAYRKAAHRYL